MVAATDLGHPPEGGRHGEWVEQREDAREDVEAGDDAVLLGEKLNAPCRGLGITACVDTSPKGMSSARAARM